MSSDKSLIRKYIKNLTTVIVVKKYNSDVDINKFKRFIINCLRNYCSLRLRILQNDKIKDVEFKIIIACAKAGIKYAIKEYNINIKNEDIDKVIEYILPELLDEVHKQRANLFTQALELIQNYEDKQK